MPMNIEIVKIKNKLTDRFSIWIDEDQSFNYNDFITIINSLEIKKIEQIYSSFGPAQFIDEIHTKFGIFNFSQEFDEFAGSTIYSDNQTLMNNILNIMIESEKYKIRK